MEGNILVTPEKLRSTAEEFSQNASQVNNLTQQMLQIIKSLNGTWADEAYTAFAGKFNSLETDMTKIFRMITEHSSDLQQFAINYDNAVMTNVDTANSQQTNVIS